MGLAFKLWLDVPNYLCVSPRSRSPVASRTRSRVRREEKKLEVPKDKYSHLKWDMDEEETDDEEEFLDEEQEVVKFGCSYTEHCFKDFRWMKTYFDKYIRSDQKSKKILGKYDIGGYISPKIVFPSHEDLRKAKEHLQTLPDYDWLQHIRYIRQDGCYKILPRQCLAIANFLEEYGDPKEDADFLKLFCTARRLQCGVKYY